eukprot:TRINITY_DN13044_c0_g1_i8.p1 TRINITY_DN13044_c0_g1~~TRINITY_DN13044_c0_g1_i8.p1  ORF type:complete len:646 (+),score=207.97 TRINITY_DN13044_c0_g1_i8:105-2042(+)
MAATAEAQQEAPPQGGGDEVKQDGSTLLTQPASLDAPATQVAVSPRAQAGRTALPDSQGLESPRAQAGRTALPDSQEVHAGSTAQQPRMCRLDRAPRCVPQVTHTDSEHGYWTKGAKDGAGQVARGGRGGGGAAREGGPEAEQAGWRFVETPAPDLHAAELTSEMMHTLALAAGARREYQRVRCLQWENLIGKLGPRSMRRAHQKGSDDPPFAGPPIECPLCAGLGFVPSLALTQGADGKAGYVITGTTTGRGQSLTKMIRKDEAARKWYKNADDNAPEPDISHLIKAYGDQERVAGKAQLRQWLEQAARQEHSLRDFQVPLRPDKLEKEETERRRQRYFEYQHKLLGQPAWAGRELPSCYADLGVAPGDHESAKVIAEALGIDATALSPGGHDPIDADHYQTYGPPKPFVPAPEFTLTGSREFDEEERQDIAEALERRLRGAAEEADKDADAGDDAEGAEQDVDVAAMQAKVLAEEEKLQEECQKRLDKLPKGRQPSQPTKTQIKAVPCRLCQPHKVGRRGQQPPREMRPTVICPRIPASMVLDRLPDEVFAPCKEWMQQQLPGYEKSAAFALQAAEHAGAGLQPEKQGTPEHKKPKQKKVKLAGSNRAAAQQPKRSRGDGQMLFGLPSAPRPAAPASLLPPRA